VSVRLALIGAGLMGSGHASIVAKSLPGASLHLICDSDFKQARAVADEYGSQDVATDPYSVISRPDIDAVIIATPDDTHAPLSLACIKAGKRVLCEKPLSQSSSECISVMEVEQSVGEQFVMLGFMRRFDQAYMEMKEAVDQDQLGRVLMMHNYHRNVETPTPDFTSAMAITNSASHEFDVVRHVLGVEYYSINSHKARRLDGVVEPVLMILETTDNQIVSIEINNNASYGYDIQAEIVGEQGSISVNNIAFTKTDRNLASFTRYDSDWRSRFQEAYLRQNYAFLGFVESGIFPEMASDCWDGYCAAKVAEAGVEALVTGMKQTIEMIEKPKLYQAKNGVGIETGFCL